MLNLKQAYKIGKWVEMAYRLNELANASSIACEPLTVDFYTQNLAPNGVRVVIKLFGQRPEMTTQDALSEVDNQEIADTLVNEARDFLKQMKA